MASNVLSRRRKGNKEWADWGGSCTRNITSEVRLVFVVWGGAGF